MYQSFVDDNNSRSIFLEKEASSRENGIKYDMMQYLAYHDELHDYVKTKINDQSFWRDFNIHASPGDGHCFMHSVLRFLHNMPVINLSIPCLRNVFELLKLETISNIGYYTPFYDNFTKDQLLNQMKMYITDKVYDTRYGDLVPLVTSNALNIGIVIIEKMANGQHDVRIVQPRQNIISNTSLIYVYKCGDHYDACLPTNSQTKYFVDIKKNFLPLAERIETEINQNDCIDPSSRQVKVSCSDENLNHMQSKYVPHHVNNKAKIAHLNTRSLYPKIDEIRCILDKNNFDIFCVSETWLHKYIKNDEIRIPGYNVFRKDRTTGVGGGVCIYVKETMHVNMRADLMFENIEAIWVEIRQGDTKYLVSCIYRPPSATTEYYERIVDMFECVRMPELPVISLGDLNFNYIMDETLLIQSIILKLHMICISWSTNRHEWMIKPPLCWMSFLRPIQHSTVRVQFLNIHWVTTILFTLIWNLNILNHQWMITTLWNFVTWKISIWRVSPMI